MAYTVAASFNEFYENINLNGDHRQIANARRDNIVTKLSRKFEIVESFSSGSIPKFTALKGHADLDIIVALHYGKHIKNKTPTQILQDVRDALSEWRTGARKNGQAVTLYYETWPNVDVVPVFRVLNDNGTISHYSVPDSNTNNWIPSRPKSHSMNIESKSSACGYNFRRIIKMIKHWNKTHSSYLQSYHIEVLALKIFNSNLDDTPWHIFQFFEKAKPLLANSLWHELNFVDDYLSWSDRQEAIKRFDKAINKSRDAWHKIFSNSSDHKVAIEIWQQVFGDKFPSYG